MERNIWISCFCCCLGEESSHFGVYFHCCLLFSDGLVIQILSFLFLFDILLQNVERNLHCVSP